MSKLTRSQVDRFTCLLDKSQVFLWCTNPSGFGLRCTREGAKSFVVQSRIHGRQRRETIGRFGVYTVEQARRRAEDLLRDLRDGVEHSGKVPAFVRVQRSHWGPAVDRSEAESVDAFWSRVAKVALELREEAGQHGLHEPTELMRLTVFCHYDEDAFQPSY